MEKLAQFNRERIPERIVHAKGGGAFGEFVVTGDVSRYTQAAVFQPGTTTETVQRFSSVAGEQGSPDTWRDVRGFSVKFYTSEGNYDIVGNNTPVFFIRDGIKFPDFIHSQKRLPGSGLRDADMQWDFWTLSPESAHQVTYLMGDRGIPRSWRHMPGYGSHTYQWINAAGERFWVKYHFHALQGNEEMEGAEAEAIAGADADYYRRDLYEAIERGDFPAWKVSVQVMPYEEAKTYRFNPFDLTKVWPHERLPADRGRHAHAQPQPGELLRADRAGGVLAGQHRAGHRHQPRQDADGARLLLPGCSALPRRHQLQRAAGERAGRPGAQLLAGRRDPPRLQARRRRRSTRRTRPAAPSPTRRAPEPAAGSPTAS